MTTVVISIITVSVATATFLWKVIRDLLDNGRFAVDRRVEGLKNPQHRAVVGTFERRGKEGRAVQSVEVVLWPRWWPYRLVHRAWSVRGDPFRMQPKEDPHNPVTPWSPANEGEGKFVFYVFPERLPPRWPWQKDHQTRLASAREIRLQYQLSGRSRPIAKKCKRVPGVIGQP